MIQLYLLLSLSFSFDQPLFEYNDYVCFQGGNSLCPSDQNYQIFHNSQNLTDYLLSNINNENVSFTIFIANTKQDIIFLNCSLMPSNINITGYSDSYVYIDFGNGHDSKHPQDVTISNLKVKSIRSESEKNQNELKSTTLNLFNVKFINDEPLEIEADDIQASFNSLQKVSKIEGDKTIKLRGLPSNSNNEDLNLTVSLHADTFILESFNDNASIDFLSSKENDHFYSLIQFKSFKNSLITVSSENYEITMNYDTQLSFYYDRSDSSSLKKLSDESAKVSIKIESENANVLFSDDKWPNTKILKDHHDDDFGSIEFDLSCNSNVTIQSSAASLPLSINQCKNAHLIFNEQSASISSLELTSGGQYLIENKKEGGEVIFNDHITFSPGAHLTIDEKVTKVRAHNVWSVFKTLPTQMTVNGHFEVDSGEFELLEYSVSFEYSPFPNDGKCSFVIPAKREVLMPIEIRKIDPNAKFNIRLSNDFLNEKYNDQIQTQFVSKCANIFVNMNLDYFTFYFPENSAWNDVQKSLVILYENDQYVSLKLSGLPSLYTETICLYKENDTEAEMLCEIDNFVPFKVVKLSTEKKEKVILESLYYAKINELTKAIKNVSILISSSDITLNLDGIESTMIQKVGKKPINIVIDNMNQVVGTKSLALKEVEVSFKYKSLNYEDLTLHKGTTVDDISSLSFNNVQKLSADVSLLKQISKSESASNTNFVVFNNVLHEIRFVQNGFVFSVDKENSFEVDANDYKEEDYRFVFNESNITLIKQYYKPSPLTIPLHYSNFFENNFFLVVDKSFGNDNTVLDIKLDAENVRILTYSSVVPFKFGSNLKLIQVEIGNYAGVRNIDFSSLIEIQQGTTLTLSPFSEETDRQIVNNRIHILFDNVFLGENARLVSDCENFLFPLINVEKNAAVKLEGVKCDGNVYIEGARTSVSIVSNPTNGHPSNFADSQFNLKISEDLYSLNNSPQNSPLLNFDEKSIENSFKLIKVNFENYNRSLFGSNDDKSAKLLTLLAVENKGKCQKLAEIVCFDPSVMPLSTNNEELVKFAASCENGKVEVHCQPYEESQSSPPDGDDGDGNGGGGGGKNNKNRNIALICAFGSAAIIVIVAVSVALYLKKHYKEGDSDKAQILTQLNPNGTPDAII